MSTTAPLPAVKRHNTPATYQPADKRGALLVAAEAVRIALEFGLPEPDGIGIGPTGIIEAAMPLALVMEWSKLLGSHPDRRMPDEQRRFRAFPNEQTGALVVFGWFEQRQWVLRSTDGAW